MEAPYRRMMRRQEGQRQWASACGPDAAHITAVRLQRGHQAVEALRVY